MKELIAKRGGETAMVEAPPEQPVEAATGPGGETRPTKVAPGRVRSVTVTIRGVPAEKARDVVKVAILPLHAKSTGADFDIVIRADGGLAGIPEDVLELTVREGLRQLGLGDADIEVVD